jgi:hypothetical protein
MSGAPVLLHDTLNLGSSWAECSAFDRGLHFRCEPEIVLDAIRAISYPNPTSSPGINSPCTAVCLPKACWERIAPAMSQPQGLRIDNELMEPLFQFDPFEATAGQATLLETPKMETPSVYRYAWSPLILPMFYAESKSTVCDMSPSHDMADDPHEHTRKVKGKAVSLPNSSHDGQDVFSVFDMESDLPLEDGPNSPHFDFFSLPKSSGWQRSRTLSMDDQPESLPIAGGSSPVAIGKGKARAVDPPVLAPLAFTPMEVGYGRVDWPTPSSVSGPISGSMASRYSHNEPVVPPSQNGTAPDHPHEIATPSHRRSLSDLSVHSTNSSTTPSLSKIRLKLSSPKTSTFGKRLLFRKSRESASPFSTISTSASHGATPSNRAIDPDTFTIEVGHGGGCLSPCIGDVRLGPCTPVDPVATVRESPYPSFTPSREIAALKPKTRSYSSPFPLSTVHQHSSSVPVATASTPVPIVVHNYFEEWLPRELQVYVLSLFVRLHEFERSILQLGNTWTVRKAESAKYRYLGFDKGIRELVKLSRVRQVF